MKLAADAKRNWPSAGQAKRIARSPPPRLALLCQPNHELNESGPDWALRVQPFGVCKFSLSQPLLARSPSLAALANASGASKATKANREPIIHDSLAARIQCQLLARFLIKVAPPACPPRLRFRPEGQARPLVRLWTRRLTGRLSGAKLAPDPPAPPSGRSASKQNSTWPQQSAAGSDVCRIQAASFSPPIGSESTKCEPAASCAQHQTR